jgi:HSP20 family protein
MSEHRQSFLERLTGTRKLPENELLTPEDQEELGPEIPVPQHLNDETTSALAHEEVGEEEENNLSLAEEENEEDELTDEESDALGVLAIDVYESDNELIIQSMVAGVTPENLHISVTRDTVIIQGKRIIPQGIPEDQYINQELYWGAFGREITLPFEIDTDGAEAIEKYGLLIIRLPRLDMSRAQQLKVKSI